VNLRTQTRECVIICDFSDRFYPGFPKPTSRNRTAPDHDGVFAVRASDVEAYRARFNPKPLRYNRTFELPESRSTLKREGHDLRAHSYLSSRTAAQVSRFGPSLQMRAKRYRIVCCCNSREAERGLRRDDDTLVSGLSLYDLSASRYLEPFLSETPRPLCWI